MFTVRSSHGRALYSPVHIVKQRFLFSTTCRRPAAASGSTSRTLDRPLLQPHGPVAEQLAASGVWTPSKRAIDKTSTSTETSPAPKPAPKKRRSAKPSRPAADKSRVNIVSDKLCDDILSYIGSSLERHRGCDLLDIYPGAGVWSGKLHQFLQPRSHILLEPDEELYRPFLQPLLDRPGTSLFPKSGIIWRELQSVLTPEFLPHQTIPDDLSVRNDTLLVTANLAFHPKKRFLNFESMASLVLHQLVDAIRSSSLFQRYGLVRMLIWARPDDKTSFLPRNIQKRRRVALENDLVCEWVHEVCGSEAETSGWYVRDEAIDIASRSETIKRMQAANLQIPTGREPPGFQEALTREWVPVPGNQAPIYHRRYHGVLGDLQAANTEDGGFSKDSDNFKLMKQYTWRATTDVRKGQNLLLFSSGLDNIIALRQSKKITKAIAKEIKAAELAWQSGLLSSTKSFVDEFTTYRDNLYAFRRTPRLLEWDRREYEPMNVQPEEFFPNINCSLLDIQPRAPHPLLRQTGPKSNRAADIFDIVMGGLFQQATHPIGPNLDALWPGASDYILPRWKSGQDLSRGGFPLGLPFAEPVPRSMDARQWEELIEIWMEWPFRPDFMELVGRAHDDLNERFDESHAPDI
ncbi:hypothetical protein F5Y03DRAFT_371178 [Xylaria venustula]|nr:hypothetical protein F5Y03DRAFT_371178 [Xylaria venustula]